MTPGYFMIKHARLRKERNAFFHSSGGCQNMIVVSHAQIYNVLPQILGALQSWKMTGLMRNGVSAIQAVILQVFQMHFAFNFAQ